MAAPTIGHPRVLAYMRQNCQAAALLAAYGFIALYSPGVRLAINRSGRWEWDPTSNEAALIDPVKEQVERDIELIQALALKLKYTLETHIHADHVTGGGLLRERLGCRLVVGERTGVLTADRQVGDGDRIRFGRQVLEARSTPGHTSGCVSYVCAQERMAFTGDALFIRGCGRTDFQQGDARALYTSVHDKIFSLPDDTRLYPGHDYGGGW